GRCLVVLNIQELTDLKIEDIRKNWAIKNRDVETDVRLWDSQAEDPTYHHIYDDFLKLLEQEHMLDKNFDVLDIGCGVGIYSIALAEGVHTVTGLDIAPKMIAHGNRMMGESNMDNISFELMDWNTVDLAQKGMRERYDLVFAHNTPAICDVDTFEKFNDASRRFCAVCSPIRMVEPVMQQIQEMTDCKIEGTSCDSNFSYMLDILLHKGYSPKLHYEKQTWPMNQSFEDACSYYLGRIMTEKQISESETADVKEYLRSLVRDGIISDQINATVATMYWEK
ncbi:MAG: methyltransferase domain-containing protein, partial [Candidatus Methanomethylophilaceae archaeon]